MTLAQHRARLARLDALRALRDPTPAQRAEYDRLQALADAHWRTLPRRIAAKRHDLAELIAFADEIGLGPC